MTATRPPQHDSTSAPQPAEPWWDDSPTMVIPVQTRGPATTRPSAYVLGMGTAFVLILLGAVALGVVLSTQPDPAGPAAAAPVQSPDQAFLADVYDTPGLTSSMSSSDLANIGWSACEVMAYQQYTRDDLVRSLGESKLGPQVMAVIVDAAHRNLCSQYDFPTVTTANSTPSTTVVPPTAPAPTGPASSVSAGTYEVGVDMLPGRYKTSGPGASSSVGSCYFERSKDDSGEFGSIIANDNIQGPGSVTVKAGEFVKFSAGCVWTRQ